MANFEEVQNGKIISNYGGVGSIIETLNNGSLIIKEYDSWRCFSVGIDTREVVNNPRLLNKIRETNGNVTRILKIPVMPNRIDGELNTDYIARCSNVYSITSEYFPTWFFCKYSRTLKRLSSWRGSWNLDDRFNSNFPSCNCHSRDTGIVRNNRHVIHREKLEQIRFLMISMDSGEIADIPFEYIMNSENGFLRNRGAQEWIFTNAMQPYNGRLQYSTSRYAADLSSVNVGNGTESISIATIYNKYLVFPEDMEDIGVKRGVYRLALRNATYLHYPNIVRCIYLPIPSDEVVNTVIELNNNFNGNLEQLLPILNTLAINAPQYQLSRAQVEDILTGRILDDNNMRNFDMAEYYYVTNDDLYDAITNEKDEKDYTAVRYPNLSYGREISKIYALTKLKETSVLLGYSRGCKRTDINKWWDPDEHREISTNPIEKRPFNNPQDYIPAIEAFGEGLFFVLNPIAGMPQDNMRKYVHTFSHMLIKELEFMCGYPATSLKERLYIDPTAEGGGKYGFLIYTIAGTEGSYGGLTSLMPSDTNAENPGRILELIKRAKKRVKDCPNDPICINEGEHHCFACLDLPETSCTEWNNDLDRRIFIDGLDSLNTDDNMNLAE